MSPLSKKTRATFTAAFVMAVGLTTCMLNTANGQWTQQGSAWPNTTSHDNREMTVEIGAKYLNRRGDSTDLPLLLDEVTGTTFLGTRDATDLQGGAGAEVRIGFKGPRYKTKWEFRSFLASWDNLYSFDDPDLITTFSQGLTPDTLDLMYESRLYSFELNAKRNTIPGLTFTCGPRIMSIVDEYLIDYDESIGGAGGTINFNQVNTVEARNTLYGMQIGFESNIPLGQRVHINTFGKLGGYMNPTRARESFTTSLGGFGSSESSKTNGAASLDAGVRAYFEILPKHAYTYVGFEVFGVDGIATAPAQLISTTESTVEVNSTLFAESVTFGMMFSY